MCPSIHTLEPQELDEGGSTIRYVCSSTPRSKSLVRKEKKKNCLSKTNALQLPSLMHEESCNNVCPSQMSFIYCSPLKDYQNLVLQTRFTESPGLESRFCDSAVFVWIEIEDAKRLHWKGVCQNWNSRNSRLQKMISLDQGSSSDIQYPKLAGLEHNLIPQPA